jgi:hypothetical protein
MQYAIYLGLYLAAGAALFVLLLWCYVAVMGLKRCRDRGTLTPLVYWLCAPVLAVGIVVDVLVNQLYMSVVCLDFMHFGTVTSRMKKYKQDDSEGQWRKAVSRWIESHIDDFDDVQGGHI